MNPLISVIIPAYNEEKNIEKCLHALEIQTIPKKTYEIIVVDGGSTDHTKLIAERYSNKVLNENTSISFARNLGAKHAKGNVILFIDADVIISKNTLQNILEVFEKHKNVSAITSTFKEGIPHNNFFSQYQNINSIYFHEKLHKFCFLAFSSILAIRKNVFQKVGRFNIKMDSHEDLELGKRLVDNGFKIYFDKKIKVKHLKFYSFKKFTQITEKMKWIGLLAWPH